MMTMAVISNIIFGIVRFTLMCMGCVALYKFIKCCNKYLDKD